MSLFKIFSISKLYVVAAIAMLITAGLGIILGFRTIVIVLSKTITEIKYEE